MKKFLKALTAVLAVVVLACAFAGCSDKSGSIKKAFEKEGYTVTVIKAEESKALMSLLDDEQKKDVDKYEVFTCSKVLQSATVVKFPSKNDIIDVIGQDAYDKAVEGGLINGNCYLLVPFGTDVKDIFKNA